MKLAGAMAAWLLAAPAAAQISIHAQVSKSDVTIDEQIALSVTVAGPESNLPEPLIPALSNLSIYDSGRSQNLSFVNGRVSSSIVYTFVVIPRAVGKAVIPPISATHKGQTVRTDPIEISVRKPDAGMPGAPGMPREQARRASPSGQQGSTPDVFLTAEVDKKKAYVNEQVTLSVKFYTAVNLMTSPQYVPPALSGFLAEDLPPERHGNENVRGRTYYFSEIKTALFPVQPGRVTIGQAAVRCEVQSQFSDPFASDFFDRFFSQGIAGRAVELRSDALTVAVEPLPEAGKPAGFSGAVGRFSAAAAVDRAAVKAGEAVTLTVTITGEGNLKALGAPALPDMPSFRAFETVSSLNLDKKRDVVRGSKVFKTVLVPKVSGDLTIPPIAFDFFDPAAQAYRRVETAAIAVKASPPDPGAAPSNPVPSAPGITAVSQDLRYLKTARSRSAATRALEAVAAAGPLHALPLAALMCALGWSRHRHAELSDPLGNRARRAHAVAESRVKAARHAAEPGARAALLAESLTGYLADRLRQPASRLTVRQAQELLRALKPGIAPDLLDEVKQVWDELDLRRFAPGGGGVDHEALAARVEGLLARLDKEVS